MPVTKLNAADQRANLKSLQNAFSSSSVAVMHVSQQTQHQAASAMHVAVQFAMSTNAT